MTPEQLAKSGSEHAHQTALFAWCAVAEKYGFQAANDFKSYNVRNYAAETYGIENAVPELAWFHSIQNEEKSGSVIVGSRSKASGKKAGVSDSCLPVKRGAWSGLYIEMKKPKGKATAEQLAFGAFVISQGFGFIVCDHWEKARDVIINYMELGK